MFGMRLTLKTLLPTLMMAILLFGYEFITAVAGLFISDPESSRMVSIPFRATVFLFCIIVILQNLGNSFKMCKEVFVLWIYELLILLRFIIDFYFRTDIYVDEGTRFRILMFIVPMAIIPMISIMMSYRQIDTSLLLKISYAFLVIAVVITYFQNEAFQTADFVGRENTFGIGTIGTGHLGLSALYMSVFMLRRETKNKLFKIIYLFVAIISMFVMFRSGSRGPLLALIAILIVIQIARTRKWIINISLLIMAFIFIDYIVEFFLQIINQISPYLYARMVNNQEEGQLASRMFHYQAAWGEFLKNPLLGSSFAIYFSMGESGYAHNVFLDSLMQWGFIGGTLITFIYYWGLSYVIRMIRNHQELIWMGLLLVQSMAGLLVSSSFYFTPVLPIVYLFLFMKKSEEV